MPNHVTNQVTITGSKEEVNACIASLQRQPSETDDGSNFDFNTILKMPEVYTEIVTGYNNIDGVRERQWREVDGKSVAIPKEEMDAIIDEHGHSNWRDWAIENWGTKWNAYAVQNWEIVSEDGEQLSVMIEFDTAWSTPNEALASLASKFPALHFEVKYADEDIGNNCGEYEFSEGELSALTEHYGKPAVEFALTLRRWSEEEKKEYYSDLEADE